MRISFPSLRDPLALIVLGGGVATACFSGTWWLAPMGIVGYGVLAWNALIAAQYPPPLPVSVPPAALALEGDYAAEEARLRILAQRISQAVASGVPMVQACFSDMPQQVDDLVTHCGQQIAKRATLDRFLAEAAEDDPALEVARLAAAEANAGDAAIRSRYAKARAHAGARLTDLEQIRRNRDRLEADCAEVANGLKNVLSRIVSLDSADEARLTGMSSEMTGLLDELQLRISTSDRLLDPAEADAPLIPANSPPVPQLEPPRAPPVS